MLEPNEIRHLERDELNSYFGDWIQKKKFYDQAKDGKLNQDHSVEQAMLLKYYHDVRD
jgi:hypothetical protein